MIETETGAETTTTTTAEDLLAAMVADLVMTTVVEAMTTGVDMTMDLLEEDPVVAHPSTILTMINMNLT